MSENINNFESNNKDKYSDEKYLKASREYSIYNDIGTIRYREEVERTAAELRRDFYNANNPRVIYVDRPTQVVQTTEAVKSVDSGETKIKGKKICVKKRGIVFFFSILLSIAMIVLVILGLFMSNPSDTLAPYLAMFRKQGVVYSSIPVLDPVIGLIAYLFKIEITNLPNSFNTVFMNEPNSIISIIIAVLVVVYLVIDLIVLIISIVGLFQKKKNNHYRRLKFGLASILMFVISIAIIILGAVGAGATSDLSNYLIGASSKTVGIAMYIMLGLPVILFICTNLTYKKVRNAN